MAQRCIWRKDTFNWRAALTQPSPVAAENYNQHAKYYFRLMAAAQAEQLEGETSDGRAIEHSVPEDLDDSDVRWPARSFRLS